MIHFLTAIVSKLFCYRCIIENRETKFVTTFKFDNMIIIIISVVNKQRVSPYSIPANTHVKGFYECLMTTSVNGNILKVFTY